MASKATGGGSIPPTPAVERMSMKFTWHTDTEGSYSSDRDFTSILFGIVERLFLVFLVLKLTHTIDWSWWWITSPLWGGVLLEGITIGTIFLVLYVKAKDIDECSENDRGTWLE